MNKFTNKDHGQKSSHPSHPSVSRPSQPSASQPSVFGEVSSSIGDVAQAATSIPDALHAIASFPLRAVRSIFYGFTGRSEATASQSQAEITQRVQNQAPRLSFERELPERERPGSHKHADSHNQRNLNLLSSEQMVLVKVQDLLPNSAQPCINQPNSTQLHTSKLSTIGEISKNIGDVVQAAVFIPTAVSAVAQAITLIPTAVSALASVPGVFICSLFGFIGKIPGFFGKSATTASQLQAGIVQQAQSQTPHQQPFH